MKSTCITILFWSLMAGTIMGQDRPCYPRQHAKLPAIVEMSYHKARKLLLASGWQPLRTMSFNQANTSIWGNTPLFWKAGYIEIEYCAGTGIAACSFLFKDAYGNRLRVTTTGQEIPREKIYAGVSSLDFVCD